MTNEEIISSAVEANFLAFGAHLDDAIEYLKKAKEKGKNEFIEFNGKKLYSLLDDRDSCYIKVTGVDYETNKKRLEEWQKKYEEQKIKDELEALEKLPDRLKRGQSFIYPQRAKEWENCVMIRTKDIYHGMELDNALDIMESLDQGQDLNKAYDIFNEADHSGMSFAITLDIVTMFSKNGVAFHKFVREDKQKTPISEEEQAYLDEIDNQNKQYQEELKDEIKDEIENN